MRGPPGGKIIAMSGPAELGRRARLYELSPRALVRTVRSALVEAIADRITTSAASLAFHWFLAIFPTAIALLGLSQLAGLSPRQLRGLVHDIGVLLPAQVSQVLDQALQRPPGSQASAIEVAAGAAVALWSATEAMAALQVALDVAYEVERDRGFLRRRLMSLPLLGVSLLAGGSASVLLVLGDPVRSLLPSSVSLAKPAFDALWLALRWAVALLLVMLLLSAYYAIGPRRERIRWDWISPGSIVASLGWVGASAAFSYYLGTFGHESRTYGAFADVAVMLLWLFLTALAVLLGAELNRELERPAEPRAGRRRRRGLSPEVPPASD
ncbi:MAG: YihY/virulence factor BrkB family protein [Acidimicrobiales bacterium]